MAAQDRHPLPAPPGQQQTFSPPQYYNSAQQQQQQQQFQQPQYQQQPQQYQQGPPPVQKPRPRSRGFSFKSEKSHKSSGSKDKVHLVETHTEKEAKRLHSKADPTLAMNEAEPAVVAATGKSQLASLRGVQHRDAFGNPIADPDRSNPTRSRWERPLDTIRSFEAAIDGGYNRKSFIRSDTESVANWNKRSSYYGNNGGRFPQDSYYGGRPASTIRANDSQLDFRQGAMTRDGLYEQGGQNGAYPNPQFGRQRYPRTASEPHFNNFRQGEQNIYPVPNNHRSYETVASGSGGSGLSGEQAGYQTDPTSSDNSSIERRQSPPKRQEPVNDYGIGFNQTPEYQPSAFTVGMNGQPQGHMQQNGYQNAAVAAPPVPRKDASMLRKPTTNTSMNSYQQQRPDMGEKRKSWFTRRFSKQS